MYCSNAAGEVRGVALCMRACWNWFSTHAAVSASDADSTIFATSCTAAGAGSKLIHRSRRDWSMWAT